VVGRARSITDRRVHLMVLVCVCGVGLCAWQAIKSMGSALDGINELRGLNILRGAASYCKDGQVSATRPPHPPSLPSSHALLCMWVVVVVDPTFLSLPVMDVGGCGC
jgi:hypothetical protein